MGVEVADCVAVLVGVGDAGDGVLPPPPVPTTVGVLVGVAVGVWDGVAVGDEV